MIKTKYSSTVFEIVAIQLKRKPLLSNLCDELFVENFMGEQAEF
jgi:hypothetical protein